MRYARRAGPPSHADKMDRSAGNATHGHATRHVQGMSWICIVAACQALPRMSCPKAKAAPRGSAAAQSKEHLE